MIAFSSKTVVAVGEAMIEMAPVAEGTYQQRYAGDTFNTAWHIAQLLEGVATVGFVTRIGIDSFSDRFATEMAFDGLSLSGVVQDADRRMGLYVIELDGVERSFHYWRNDSAARHLADDPDVLDMAIRDVGLIHVSGITLAILPEEGRANLFKALTRARGNGSTVSFDPNFRPRLWSSHSHARSVFNQMLGIADIVLPSFDDEAALWNDPTPGETIKRIRSHGVPEIVVKNGAHPVFYGANGELASRSTPPVDGIRDTTGAGDGFNAGYLAARLQGLRPEQSIAVGQTLSAEILNALGARAPQDVVRELGWRGLRSER